MVGPPEWSLNTVEKKFCVHPFEHEAINNLFISILYSNKNVLSGSATMYYRTIFSESITLDLKYTRELNDGKSK